MNEDEITRIRALMDAVVKSLTVNHSLFEHLCRLRALSAYDMKLYQSVVEEAEEAMMKAKEFIEHADQDRRNSE